MRYAAAMVLLLLAGPALAQSDAPDAEEQSRQRLAAADAARQLYLQGESAYKRGDLSVAIRSWMEALKLKPESSYTKTSLAKARGQLYKQYTDYAKKNAKSKDVLSKLAMLDSVVPLLPERTELGKRAEELRAGLTSDQKEAYRAYLTCQACLGKSDYAGAKAAIAVAQRRAGSSACVIRAARTVDQMLAGSGRAAQPAKAGVKPVQLPRMMYVYADW